MPSLEAVQGSDHELVGLVTQPDRPRGRSGRPEPPPAKARLAALAPGVPVLQPERPRGADFRRRIAALRPDVSVVAAYGNLLPERVLALPPLGSLNVHASLLPRHRGAAPVAAAILCGDPVTGITLMRMAPGLDTGPILLQRALPVGPDESCGELTARLAALGAEVLLEGLAAAAAGRLAETPQEPALATYAPRIAPADARLDWSLPAAELARRIRAYDPWPGAATGWEGRRLKLFRARPLEAPPAAPGTVLAAPAGILRVAAGGGAVEIGEVQLEGRPRMSAGEFLRGRALAEGTRLG